MGTQQLQLQKPAPGTISRLAANHVSRVSGAGFGLFFYFQPNQPLCTPQGHFVWRDNRTMLLSAKGNFDGR